MLPDAIQRRKRLEDKATWPGRKQVCRHYDESGIMTHDELSRDNDARDGVALLRPVMMAGILYRVVSNPDGKAAHAFAKRTRGIECEQ